MSKRQFPKRPPPDDSMSSPRASLSNTDNGACPTAYGDSKDKTFFEAETALKNDNRRAVEKLRHDRLLNGNPWSTVPRPVEG